METTTIFNGAPTIAASSQTVETAVNAATTQSAPKLMVEIDISGRLRGPNTQQMVTLVGELVRTHIPVSYLDWRIVPKILKENVWNKLLQKYEFNVSSNLAKKFVMKTFPQKLRSFKWDLRRGPLKGKVTEQQKLDACPLYYNLDHWKEFVKNESNSVIKRKHAKCAENHKKKSIRHTLGRLSYANKLYNLAQQEHGLLDTGRGVSWMKGHVGKDGKVHPSAVETYEKVKAATEKRKSLIDAGLVDPMDIDNDEIIEVFGPDKGKSGLLGYSPHTSKAQTLQANLATSVMAAKGAKIDEIELERTTQLVTKIVLQAIGKMNIQQKNNLPQDTVEDQQQDQPSQAMGDQQQNHYPISSQATPIFQSPVVQSSNHTVPFGVENPRDGVQFVHLFDRKRFTVATGYVVYGKDGEECHGVSVLADERKICLESIEDGQCRVPDAPQGDDRNQLWEYTRNEWLIWPVSRMEFINE